MNIIRRMALACVMITPAICLAGCDVNTPQSAEQASANEPDPANARAEIDEVQALRIKALESRDVDAAVAVYAADATMITPGKPPLTDPASIRANFAALLGDDKFRISIEAGKTWVSAGADFAVTTAHIRIVGSRNGEPPAVLTDSMNQSVWQKQLDGSWKIESDYSVGLPAAPAPVADGGSPAAADGLQPTPGN